MNIVKLHAPWRTLDDLRVILAAGTTLNAFYLDAWDLPPLAMDGTVVYRREPEGREDWLTLPLLLERGAGDCEDLSMAYAASWGGFPDVYSPRPGLVHVIVRNPTDPSRRFDPSRVLGM
jgi:hypothetical protein